MVYLALTVGLLVLLLVIGPLIGLYVRRRILSNRGGVFDCGLRQQLEQPTWVLGLARYESDTLEWYRVFSSALHPRLVLHRGQLEVVGRRAPNDIERVVLFENTEIVRIRILGQHNLTNIELAMAPDSVMGLMSWIEAAPMGGQRYPGVE